MKSTVSPSSPTPGIIPPPWPDQSFSSLSAAVVFVPELKTNCPATVRNKTNKNWATLAQGQGSWNPIPNGHRRSGLTRPSPSEGRGWAASFPGSLSETQTLRLLPDLLDRNLPFGGELQGIGGWVRTCEFGKRWAGRLQWGNQSSWEGSFSRLPPAVPRADPPALTSCLSWRRWLRGLTSAPAGQAALFILIGPWSSQRLRDDTAFFFLLAPNPCSCPHTILPSLACRGPALLPSWGDMFMSQLPYWTYGTTSQPCADALEESTPFPGGNAAITLPCPRH
ncbi:hypothetical protein HJG60_008073 [Phyllostomus discolor]|uniref:Uncharacterized protein n=1 Tax=Phyllostomus discolor TaxID=89673 RepID=A0A834BLB8_9CHIR|nr:hypothetical protein HJG60_008073 [Phyllostomus discolor]